MGAVLRQMPRSKRAGLMAKSSERRTENHSTAGSRNSYLTNRTSRTRYQSSVALILTYSPAGADQNDGRILCRVMFWANRFACPTILSI